MIRLPSKPSDSLEWDLSRIPESALLWHFDLGLEEPFFPLHDEMRFQSLSLAFSKFKNEVWPIFQDRTKGIVLYKGSADFSRHFLWSDKQTKNWISWKESQPQMQEDQLKRLFCADAFIYYFQMLSYSLPDEVPVYLFLDASEIHSIIERHHLISKERFEHFQIVVKGLPEFNGPHLENEEIKEHPLTAHALCFPLHKECKQKVLGEMENIFTSLKQPFRVISEAFLTEEWEGVEVLHVLKNALSPLGERKLKGFEATGGVIVYY